MKTDSIRMGIIGTGSMGRIHAESIQSGRVPGMCLKAVAGHSPEGVQRLREDFPAEVAVYPSAEDLIESGSCDAVLIAAPHREHPRLAMEAFAHGLHVMCEKPAGVDTKQVRAMNEAARESGKVFGMMFNQRADGLYKTMHVLLEKKALGEIKRVNWIITDWYRHQAYYDSRTWRATWAGEGGRCDGLSGVSKRRYRRICDLHRRRARDEPAGDYRGTWQAPLREWAAFPLPSGGK